MNPVGSNGNSQPVQPFTQDPVVGAAKSDTPKTDSTESKTEDRIPQNNGRSAAESQMTEKTLQAELLRRFGSKDTPSRPVEQKPQGATSHDDWFHDADQLEVAKAGRDQHIEANTYGSMLKADLMGAPSGKYPWNSDKPLSEKEKTEVSQALEDAFQDKQFTEWIESKPERRARVEEIVRKVAPKDPSVAENAEVNKKVDSFKDWKKYPYQTIIVPGYTPLDQKQAVPGVNDVGKERLAKAKAAFDEGKAPFILLSGGNVYPRGTHYHEAIEMKKELIRMGVPADRIIVDAAARHTTTNMRNAGRYMLDHNMKKGLVVTGGGPGGPFDQEFYLSNPGISTFNMRCRKELGYEVGTLKDVSPDPRTVKGPHKSEIEYVPSDDVKRFHYRDPLDT
jgi:hypothetical protein